MCGNCETLFVRWTAGLVWCQYCGLLNCFFSSHLQTFGEPTRDAALYTAGDDAVILTRPRDFVVRKDETLPLDCPTCIWRRRRDAMRISWRKLCRSSSTGLADERWCRSPTLTVTAQFYLQSERGPGRGRHTRGRRCTGWRDVAFSSWLHRSPGPPPPPPPPPSLCLRTSTHRGPSVLKTCLKGCIG